MQPLLPADDGQVLEAFSQLAIPTLDFLQTLLLHLPIQDGELVFAILVVAKQLDERWESAAGAPPAVI
jgi:hypothetical protein